MILLIKRRTSEVYIPDKFLSIRQPLDSACIVRKEHFFSQVPGIVALQKELLLSYSPSSTGESLPNPNASGGSAHQGLV